MWISVIAVTTWVVIGMVITAGEGLAWVTAGAIALAVATPSLGYRYAKGMMLHLLHKFDPVEFT